MKPNNLKQIQVKHRKITTTDPNAPQPTQTDTNNHEQTRPNFKETLVIFIDFSVFQLTLVDLSCVAAVVATAIINIHE